METNKQRLIRAGVDITNIKDLLETYADDICATCNAEINKNLCPTSPACEGRWCEEAIAIYLEQEAN